MLRQPLLYLGYAEKKLLAKCQYSPVSEAQPEDTNNRHSQLRSGLNDKMVCRY